MKNIASILIFVFIVISGCKDFKEYTKVPDAEIIELLKERKVTFLKIDYVDQYGIILTDSLRLLLNQGKMARHFYRDLQGEITQSRLVPLTDSNVMHEIRTRELQYNPFQDIDYVTIDCSDAKHLYKRAFKRDQDIRTGSISMNGIAIDKLNRDTIFSLIDKCKWPKTKDEITALWYIVQHGESEKMAFYYPEFEQMVHLNLLEPSLLAKMQDRLLMNNGFPQIYGTQIAPPHSFHKIKDPRNVNKRRIEVGLDSIEITARKFGFEFRLEDYL